MAWIIISALVLACAGAAFWAKRSAAGSIRAHAQAVSDHADADAIAKEAAIAAGRSNYSAPIPPRMDTNYPEILRWSKIAMVAFLVIFALETLGFSFQIVSTKNVGIVTQFGATSGHLTNGAHLIGPWESVTEMDAAIQTDSYTADNCLNVRVGNQQQACVHISIRWRINPSFADSLFQNYRTFSNVQDSLVTRELTAAVNQQFSNYNPLNSILTGTRLTAGEQPNPPLVVYAQRVTAQMKREIGSEGIVVLNTIIPIVTFDPATQSRINQLQQQIALTRIAEQERVTNEAQSLANKALAASVNTSPNVLVAQCFTILGEMVKQGQSVPPAFSCWPGGSKVGVLASTGTGK